VLVKSTESTRWIMAPRMTVELSLSDLYALVVSRTPPTITALVVTSPPAVALDNRSRMRLPVWPVAPATTIAPLPEAGAAAMAGSGGYAVVAVVVVIAAAIAARRTSRRVEEDVNNDNPFSSTALLLLLLSTLIIVTVDNDR
jgi:hypothetical protein